MPPSQALTSVSRRVQGLAAACADDAVRILAKQVEGAWSDEAVIELLDDSPGLSLSLLLAAPLGQGYTTQRQALRAAVKLLGEDLLLAWLHQTAHAGSPRQAAFQRLSRHARSAARLGYLLARESQLCEPEHAWCAGLWHNLGQAEYCARFPGYPGPTFDRRESQLAAGEVQQYGEDHGALLARAIERVLDIPLLPAAIELHHAAPDFVRGMPGLPRVLRAVVGLLAHPEDNLAFCENLLGIRRDRLREIMTHLPEVPLETFPAPSPLQPPALRSLLSSAFADLQGERFAQRLRAATHLLGQRPLALLLRRQGDQLVRDGLLHAGDASALPDLTGSSCLRSLHQMQACGSHAEGPNPADWLLARHLGMSAFECVPWQAGEEGGVAVFEIDPRRGEKSGALPPPLLVALSAAMNAQSRALRARRAMEDAVAKAREAEVSSARRIAHEVSNPLSVIGNYLAILEGDSATDADTQFMLRQMQAEIARTRRLLSGIGHSGPPEAGAGNCNPNQILHEVAALHRDSLLSQHKIAVQLNLAAAVPAVRISADALRQVLINLILNAADAIGQDGVIQLGSSLDINLDGQAWIELSVQDDGPGLPRPGLVLELPTTSNKESNRAGTGLAVCRTLMEQAGGHLVCHSSARRGTRFSLLLEAAI